MTMKRLLISIILTLSALNAGAQRLYVATDKSCYLAGEMIGCSAFCSPGPPVACLELVSAEGSAAQGKIALNEGRGAGTLAIPFDTPTGNYRLVSYLPGQTPDASAGPVLSIFNTLCTDRVKGGVEVVERSAAAPVSSQSGYGFAVDIVRDSLVIRNTSGSDVSFCLSLYREDSLQGAARSSIASFKPSPAREGSYVETISGWVRGSGLAERVILAVPGSKTDCCQAETAPDGSFCARTETIYGDVDLVCIPVEGEHCYVEIDSPFCSPAAGALPKLEIFRAMEGDLLRRHAAMLRKAAMDTLSVSLPMRREHFFLERECRSYILDDYTRFPTMEEVFVELIPEVKMRRRSGKVHIYALMEKSVTDGIPRWGDAVVMIDGVPVPDQGLIESYDPALIKRIDIYPYQYQLGGPVFDGVINLVTFKGNMPGLLFDESVRIYSYHGCSAPVSMSGSETFFWHPLSELPAGGSLSIPLPQAAAGLCCTLSLEGLTTGGSAVYFRKTFCR